MQEPEFIFIARITRAVTHEINNVFGIIKESSGLLEDYLSLVQKEAFPYHDKFIKVISTIQAQIRRGVTLTTGLNRFAHSMQELRAAVDLNNLVQQVVFLLQRQARTQEVELIAYPAEHAVEVITDPLRLQLIIGACIEYLLGIAGKEGQVGLTATANGREAGIQIWAEPGAGEELSPGLDMLPEALRGFDKVLDDLQIKLIILKFSRGEGFFVSFPAR